MTTPNEELRKLAETMELLSAYFPGGPTAKAAVAIIELLDRIDRLEAENEAQRKLLVRSLECADISNIVLAKVEPSGHDSSDDVLDETMAMNRQLRSAITQHLKGTP